MPNSAEIIERSVNDFQKVQLHMITAKKENATETLIYELAELW